MMARSRRGTIVARRSMNSVPIPYYLWTEQVFAGTSGTDGGSPARGPPREKPEDPDLRGRDCGPAHSTRNVQRAQRACGRVVATHIGSRSQGEIFASGVGRANHWRVDALERTAGIE